MTRPPVRSALLYLLFFFSGSAGLGYQMVWSRMFATGLGHELPAVLAIIGAFMGGMSLGAWALDKRVSRSALPGCWYAALEIVIGLWGFLSALLIPWVSEFAAHLIGVGPSALRHWTVALALPFLTILPATAAMGATLPAMEGWVAPLVPDRRCVGALYAVNTLGAVAGTLLSAFFLMPTFGMRETVWLLAALNLLCGVVVLAAGRFRISSSELQVSGSATGTGRPQPGTRNPKLESRPSPVFRRLGLTVFFTGLLGIGFETVGVRVMSQVLESTSYTFAAVLSIFLLGAAVGAALYQRWGRRAVFQLLLTDLLCALAAACVLGILVLARAQRLYDAARGALGDSPCAVLGAEMLVAAAVFGLPTMLMGALFSHLVQTNRRPEGGIGQAAALNTLGGALAAAVFSVLFLPWIGSKWTLVLIAVGYLALVPRVSGWRWASILLPLALIPTLPSNLHLGSIPPGGQLVEYREGVMASVSVLKDPAGHRSLRVDNRFQMGGTAATSAERRHAHIPLLLHPEPRRALFLGLGTGITMGAAAAYPGLQSDGVELVPEVVAVMHRFEPENAAPVRHPRMKVQAADARRFVRATDVRYDVIVADLFHPARDGAGSLYTREHFQAIRERLGAGGIFCQWLPLYQLDESMLRVIIRTFLEVFPETHGYLLRFNVDAPAFGLIGYLEAPRYSANWVEDRLVAPELEAQLKSLALADSVRLFGCLVAGPPALRQFAGSAPLNTDNQPRVSFGAPRFTYQKDSDSYGRLLALLRCGTVNPVQTLRLDASAGTMSWTRRLTDFITARDVYLHGLIDEAEGRSEKARDAFVESARLSVDFTSGYAQCLTLASLQAKAKPAEARALLERLIEAQPSRPIAREMLRRLFEN